MKKIYVILMHTGSIPSKLVNIFTRYQYTHVGIALEKNCFTIYSFGRKKLNWIFNGGFTIENKTGAFFSKFKQTNCKIFEIEITTKKYQKLQKKLLKMQKNADFYKYDFLGIIPRFIGIPISFKNKYVCSSFVATILNDLKICNFSKPTCLVKPKDFNNLLNLQPIYEGIYNLYN